MFKQKPGAYLLGRGRRLAFPSVCIALWFLFFIPTPALGSPIRNWATPGRNPDILHESNLVGASASDLLIDKEAEQAAVDLWVEKSAHQPTAWAGGLVSYTISYGNRGSADAAGVQIVDAIPASAAYSAGSIWGTGADDSEEPTLIWEVMTVTANTGAQQIGYAVVLNSGLAPGTVVANTAAISSAYGIETSAPVTVAFAVAADLAIAKPDSPDPVAAGATLTYTLVYTNDGPSDAQGITITDTLPLDVVYGGMVSMTSSLFGPTRTGQSLVWYTPTLAAGKGGAIVFTVTVDSGAIVTLTNRAAVASSTPDLNLDNNEVEEPTTIAPVADLSLDKLSSPDPGVAGTTLTYTLVYTNDGPSDAQDVIITDTLSNVIYGGEVSVTPALFGPTRTGQSLVWYTPTLAAGKGGAIVFTVTVDPGVIVTLTNRAAVASSTPDLNLDNNEVEETTMITTVADLSVEKSNVPNPVVAGTTLTYTLVYTNDGPSDAQDVIITDTLSNVIYGGEVSVTPALFGPTQTGQFLTWYTPTLAAGASCMLVFTVTVDPGAGGSLSNSVVVASSTPDPNASDNVAASYTTVIREADLSISKTAHPLPAIAGATLIYTLTITNHGPSNATGVEFFDILPSDVSFDSAASSPDCTEPAPGLVTCSVGNVAANANAMVTLVVAVSPAVADGATLTNWARVAGNETDPNYDNDGVTEETAVRREADLMISKTDFPDPVIANTALTYTLTIDNQGPSDAAGVRLFDLLPDGVSFNPAASDPRCTEPTAGGVTCNVDHVAANDSTTVTIVVVVSASMADGATLANWAVIASDETDPHNGDNSASANTTVHRKTDLEIVKSDHPDPAIAGTSLTYTLVYTNSGPLDAPSVTILDTLPDGVTYGGALSRRGQRSYGVVTRSAMLGDPIQTGQELTWYMPTLALGDAGVIVFTVTVDADASGIITNNVSIASSMSDLDPSNNDASEPTTLIRRADLAVGKASSPDPVAAGEILTYTLVYTNVGPSDAQEVAITDTLPADVAYGGVVTRSAAFGDPIQTDRKLAWYAPTLAVGARGAIVFTVTVASRIDASGIITNRVVITDAIPDPNPGDNDADEPTLVNPALVITKTAADLNGAPLYPGDVIEYRVLVRNTSGIRSQTHVTITDPMPANTALVAGSVACTPGTICWESRPGRSTANVDSVSPADDGGTAMTAIESLGPGELLTLTFRARVSAGVFSIGENIAVVESDSQSELESNLAGGGAVEPGSVVVKSAADVNGARLRAGDTVEYQIVVTNTNTIYTQANVTISDTAPASTTLAAESVACSPGAIWGESGGVITATASSLGPGDLLTLTFQVTVDDGASSIGGNVAVVKSDNQNEQRTRPVYPPDDGWNYIYLSLVMRGYR